MQVEMCSHTNKMTAMLFVNNVSLSVIYPALGDASEAATKINELASE